MGKFRWFDAGSIPAAYDLRRCGWRLVDGPCGPRSGIVCLVDMTGRGVSETTEQCGPASTVLVGVAEPAARVALLRAGFGEVLGPEATLDELEARAARVVARLGDEPPQRRHGTLTVDLRARDAFVGTRAVGLHPREFALLWRLMAAPGEAIGKARLLAEVWRLHHVPETNSLPVHVSRLRRKLGGAGYPGLIATVAGGYAYVPPSGADLAVPLAHSDGGLDEHVRMADDAPATAIEDEP